MVDATAAQQLVSLFVRLSKLRKARADVQNPKTHVAVYGHDASRNTVFSSTDGTSEHIMAAVRRMMVEDLNRQIALAESAIRKLGGTP